MTPDLIYGEYAVVKLDQLNLLLIPVRRRDLHFFTPYVGEITCVSSTWPSSLASQQRLARPGEQKIDKQSRGMRMRRAG